MPRPRSKGIDRAAMALAPAGAAAKRIWRSVPALIWLILALHLLVVLCQSAIFPNFRSPDERLHVDLIVMVEKGEAWPWPAPGTLRQSQGSAAGGFTPSHSIRGPLHLADEALPPRGDRESYVDAGGTASEVTLNQLIQHPPLYYLAGAAVLTVIPNWEDAPFDRVFLLLRWWNALLTAPIPLILWAIARRLRLPDPVPVAAALVPLAIPELTHLESSVNNDNLFLTLAALVAYLVTRVLTGDTSRRTAVAIGGLTTLALLTKGFALMMPAWVVVAYAVAAYRHGRRTGLTSLAVACVAMVPGAAWWIRNRVLYGSLQPHGTHTERPDLTVQYGWSDGGARWLAGLVDRLITLFFVHDQTGQRQHHGSWKMAIVAVSLLLLGVAATLLLRAIPRVTSFVLLLPVFALLAIVAKGSWEQFAAHHLMRAGMQGRYLYGGLAGLAIVAVAAISRLPARARPLAPLGLLLFAAAIHTVYLSYTLGLFWRSRDGARFAGIEAIFDWYALPSPVLALVMAATAAAAIAVATALIRRTRPRPDAARPPSGDSDKPIPAPRVPASPVPVP